jgi:adenine-specific DNA-methyltransferase
MNITTDTITPQLALLKKHFANCFDKHGNFIPARLQEVVESSGVVLSKEGYRLNWLGKSYARLLANEAIRTRLVADTAHNTKAPNVNSQNLLIKGDNLEVLKHLMGAYNEQVKMIYIDPPYNTGSDGFVYQDDRKFSVEQLSSLAGIDEIEAARILEFTSSHSNSHSAWLTFMYPRLYIAKQLLRDDGVIFISIDDNEQAQLKILCDEVFGEENFVAQMSILCNPKGRSQDKFFATNHEYAFAYSKTMRPKGCLSIEKDDHQIEAEYPEEDEGGKYRVLELRNTHREFGKHNRKDMFFPLYVNEEGEVSTLADEGIKVLPIWDDGYEGCWTWGKPKAIAEIDLLIGKKIDGKWKIYRKSYANGAERMLKTILFDKSFFTERGQKSFNGLFGTKAKIFQSPKSPFFITELLKAATLSNDIIIDFFAGSGTTAHAVMQLNAEDGGNRQFICVQIDEMTDPKSEAYKAGYKSIFDITYARISKAAAKIKESLTPDATPTLLPESDGLKKLRTLDLGFKVFETLPMFDKYLDEPEELTENLELFDVNTLSQNDRHSLMLTWALRDGIKPGAPLAPVTLGGYTAYAAGKILYFIEPDISLDAVIALLEQLDNNPDFSPSHLVVPGYLLDSKIQREMTEAVKHYNNRKGIVLNLDIRYN